jgi:hypothetical protein
MLLCLLQGLLRNGTVAVKKLLDFVDFDDQKFIREIDCLMRVKHKNIIRFLGYCSDTQGKLFSFDGKIVMAECRQRFLCFEYASGGSLENYITGAYEDLATQNVPFLPGELCIRVGVGRGGAYNETTFTKLSTVLAKFRHICGNSSIRTENMAYHTTEKE